MRYIRPLLVTFGALSLLTGLIYPAVITLLAHALFPRQAEGSLLIVSGQVRGSRLIAQATADPRYFWSRPSPTPGFPTNAAVSGGSALASMSPALEAAVTERARRLRAADPDSPTPIPQDLVTGSASGLDPHLSLEGALWQIPRIAKARKRDPSTLETLVRTYLEGGSTSPERVNVLVLNAALDGMNGR